MWSISAGIQAMPEEPKPGVSEKRQEPIQM